MEKFIGKSSGELNYSLDVQIWSMKNVSVRRKLPQSCWTCTRLSRGCDSSWTRHPERCPLLLIYPARRTRRHRQYHTLCVTVGEYWQTLQPDTKYSGYLNTQGNMSESKNTLHTNLYDEFGEGFGERLQHFRRFFSAVQLKAADSNSGQVTHQTRHHLHRQQNQHRQPVKTVMDRRPSKRPWEREHRWSTKDQQKNNWSL